MHFPIHHCRFALTAFAVIAHCVCGTTWAETELLKLHCGECHMGESPEGDFALPMLGERVTEQTRELWEASFDYVMAGEMPPADESEITPAERKQLAQFLRSQLLEHQAGQGKMHDFVPRRLNNREFAKSISAALLLKDPGTHFPLGDLIGDGLHEGFDTHGDALGISEFHIEQYIEAARRVIDGIFVTGDRPQTKSVQVSVDNIGTHTGSSQLTRNEFVLRRDKFIEFTDPRVRMFFTDFDTVPVSGRYRITIRATGVDRTHYDDPRVGIYPNDPIRLQVLLGDRKLTYDLPDETIEEIVVDEWLAAGTRLELMHPTDGLRTVGNGNFKFQNRIAHDHIKQHQPKLYETIVKEEVPQHERKSESPEHWVHWVDHWRGPRPRVFGATVEGPIYESWPPQPQVALIGANPQVSEAVEILRPIAQRAWRRDVTDSELQPIVELVESNVKDLGPVGSLKEGIIAILASPSFLLINPDGSSEADRFAAKMAYFFDSAPPSERIRKKVQSGNVDDLQAVVEMTRWYLTSGNAEAFLSEFPEAWLQLQRINFMAPDPDRFPHYHHKSVSEDMIQEAKVFFQDAVQRNVPIPEMLTANYSFINADVAKIYGIDDVPQDSKFRKYVFTNGRRGGLLGMGAFLTLTADTLGTSPIHRAVYVLENFLGTKPAPPPGDVEIPEPDVRSATTIREVLNAHIADKTCASCHEMIDPYGYAFENFDPAGGWRDRYVRMTTVENDRVGGTEQNNPELAKKLAEQKANSAARSVDKGLPIESSAAFRNGTKYEDITGFRTLMATPENQERFVRCFIKKLLMYANGEEPDDFAEMERLHQVSKGHGYRIQETIASVVDSPLFRER